jgi:hypothetical protein
MSSSDMKDVVAKVFDLDELVFNRLIIRFKHHQPSGATQWKVFEKFQGTTISPAPQAQRRPLRIEDLVLQVAYRRGDEVPEDVSCDSTFMMLHMDAICKAIRHKYRWVDPGEELFLIVVNAGGHGTNDAKFLYEAKAKEQYNIRIIWQEPRGPELNLLDLGAWMSLQSQVENDFRGARNDANALATKVEENMEFFRQQHLPTYLWSMDASTRSHYSGWRRQPSRE